MRFSCADGAKLALEKIGETTVKVDEVEVQCSVLEGELFCDCG